MLNANILESKITKLKSSLQNVLEQAQKNREVPELLKTRLSFPAYETILKFFTEFNFNGSSPEQLPMRFAKEETKLARTVNLTKDPLSDELLLFLETKSKFENDQKQTLPDRCGAFKAGKPCYPLNLPNTEYINLVYYYNQSSHKQMTMLNNESNIPFNIFSTCKKQGLQDDDIPIIVPAKGQVINKTKYRFRKIYESRVSFYSRMANSDLINVIVSDSWNQTYAVNFSCQILNILKVVHGSNVVYQDFKPDNILLYQEPDGNYTLKLTDFGYSVSATAQKKNAFSTFAYASPELNMIGYGNSNTCLSNKAVSALIQNPKYNKKYVKNFENPDFANDVWAVGITIFSLFNDCYPDDTCESNALLSSKPWLEKMLAWEREDRATASSALEGFKDHYHVNFTPAYDDSKIEDEIEITEHPQSEPLHLHL